MTLAEIAQYAGEKVGKTDADTLVFLQKSASLNYRRVWNFAPWRETVTSSTYSVGTGRTVTLGTLVETPLSVAYDQAEIEPIDLATIVSQDPGLLEDDRAGTPQFYHFTGRNSSGVASLDLYPRLETAGTLTLRVVEKKQCLTRTDYVVDFPPSTNAINDELRLPHVHHVVLALTHADALERERQYGKAQVVTQDANANLASMANFELSQVGGIKQITPSGLGELLISDITAA
jgi:hypothetical protein